LGVAVVALGVPIDCIGAPGPSAAPFGCELAPDVLRELGIPGEDRGDLGVRLVGTARDKRNGIKAWPAVAETTSAVRAAVASVVAAGDTPLILGGCCTLLPGALAGARDAHGQIGLAYFDGHLDMYDGKTSSTGEPADMPIAVVSGVGPRDWVALVGRPVVPTSRIALVGPRDRAEAAELKAVMPEDIGIAAEITPDLIRSVGTDVVAGATLATAGTSFWVHLDVDVLDESVFPATDYLMPGGLAFEELAALLTPLVSDPGLTGFSVACYNPEKDPSGKSGAALAELITSLFES
jgi:arginase